MRLTYYAYFAPDVNVHYVVDNFGSEVRLEDLPAHSFVTRYNAFQGAKIFVTGMTFEAAEFSSLMPTVE